MLKASDVTKKYEKLVANNSVSLTVNDGEIAVLLGPNGAGKSTLIKCICGLLRFQGEISLNGKNNKSIEAKRILGYVPEMPAVYDLLTVSEHLEFICRSYRVTDDGTGDKLLKRFELYDKKDKLGKELSKGMQQKLSICCALIHKPEVIIFDEPMVGLDPYAIKELKEIFTELKNEGKSVLISTHMIDSVEDYWDTAYIMAEGELKATVKNGEGKESLRELFFSVTGKENTKI
ncbi:MAG: ABC transporter ATP-binding protein [Acutalibacteraceae bacterium]|nr:ABC transporter ATP-binding protein [Acutalibacteraceae bacterium]